MALRKKAVKKAAKKLNTKRSRTDRIVVGKKTRSDVVINVRLPKDLLRTMDHMAKNGEVRISENQFHEALHGTVVGITGRDKAEAIGRIDRIVIDGGQFPNISNLQEEEARTKSILMEAQDIIFGDREKTYGAPDANLLSIGELWTVYLRRKRAVQDTDHITPDDVAQMMILLKTGRLINQPEHRDSLVDQAGYAALQQRIHDERPF